MPSILVCGGLPRSATTYIYNELQNYENVFRSRIKESFLFERNDSFIDWKIGNLNNKNIYLDFTPEYIFNRSALKKILKRKIDCFFVIREFENYRNSVEKYLEINRIQNEKLKSLDEDAFRVATRYASDHFPTIAFDDVTTGDMGAIVHSMFGVDLGKKTGSREVRNSSIRRQHYAKALIHNRLTGLHRYAASLAFGLL